LLWICKSRDEDKNIPSCANKHKHSPWFLSLQEIHPQLSAVQFVALLLKDYVELYFVPWNSFCTEDAMWVMKQVAYSNPTDMNSEFS
jgi:hypothetical protein